MNIAIEISPLITASGSFGDKSGVYRYSYGLLNALVHKIESRYPKAQVILFTFAPTMLSFSLNPEILALMKRPNITFYGYDKKINIKRIKDNPFYVLFNSAYLKYLILFVDKIVNFRAIIQKIKDDLRFKKYVKELATSFKKANIKIVYHSETGF